MTLNPLNQFEYIRTIRFQDTDAAGVVYFANLLSICHEAYEAALIKLGCNLKLFFSNLDTAIPIFHADIDFFKPIFCGEQITIQLTPKYLDQNKFELNYQIFSSTSGQLIAKATTKHVCIDPIHRNRKELPTEIIHWLTKSDMIVGLQESQSFSSDNL